MKLLIVLAAVVLGTCLASDHPTECGRLQRLKVKTQWVDAVHYGENRERFNDEIWFDIFKLHPEWRTEFFSRVRGENQYSPEFRAHAERITGAFDIMINLLMFEEELNQQMSHIGAYHSDKGIPAEHFQTFAHAVMEAVHEEVGRCFDWDAWNLCLKVITDGVAAAMA